MGTGTQEVAGTSLTKGNFVSYLSQESIVKKIAPFLPEGVNVDRVIASARMAVEKTPDLLKCTPSSIVMSIARIQSWGLEIGTTAHLLPFGTECTPCADYKGLAELMVASGAVRHVQARAVYEGDEFQYEFGLNENLIHRPISDARKRGAIVAAYCILDLPHSRRVFDVMTAEEIEGIRQQYSKQWKKGPLQAWYAAKSVVRRISKLVPKNPRYAKVLAAIAQDAATEGQEVAAAFEIAPNDDAPQLKAGEVEMGPEWQDDRDLVD